MVTSLAKIQNASVTEKVVAWQVEIQLFLPKQRFLSLTDNYFAIVDRLCRA